MITRASDPLPPHSTAPYPATLMNQHRARLARIQLAALKAKAETLCAPNPWDYADLGPQIMSDVARAPQNDLLTGTTALSAPPPSPTPTIFSGAPTVVPLNMPADSSLLPVTSAPAGIPGATKQGGIPWGNSPISITPIQSFLSSLPPWAWIAAVALIGAGLSKSGKSTFKLF